MWQTEVPVDALASCNVIQPGAMTQPRAVVEGGRTGPEALKSNQPCFSISRGCHVISHKRTTLAIFPYSSPYSVQVPTYRGELAPKQTVTGRPKVRIRFAGDELAAMRVGGTNSC